jgi:hypothetical protein
MLLPVFWEEVLEGPPEIITDPVVGDLAPHLDLDIDLGRVEPTTSTLSHHIVDI